MMNYLSLFSGIGAFEKAMINQDIPFNLVGYSEIDKYASKSYSAIYGVDESMNLGDITKIDEKALPPIDFITYGFPCQDISLAGKQKGLFNEDGTQTRSGLFFDALRIIEATQPKVAIAENVKNLCSRKFAGQFKIVLDSLEQAGYNNYWKVLNSKDFGIPQNRERVFIVSIRKDCDTGVFEFPEGYPLEKRLKDILEDEVDEKFYINKTLGIFPTENYIQWDNSGKGYNSQAMRAYYQDGLMCSQCASNTGDKCQVVLADKVQVIGNVNPSGKGQNGQVVDSEGLARTITQEKGEGQKILVREATIQRIDIPQIVKVRKYEVDTEKLCDTLRKHKEQCGWTNKELAKELELPLTTVEHWFRKDNCFAIPEPEIWEELKWLLEMDDINEFDESIMTFEEKEGAFEKAERHYSADGIMPTLTSTVGNEKILVRTVGKINSSQDGVVVDPNGISPTHTAGHGNMPKVLVKTNNKKGYDEAVVTSAAMRGRYNENGQVEQNIEVSNREVANAITTVQKDSMVAEPMALDEQNRYIRKDGCVGTLTTDGSSPKHNNRVLQSDLRIRKLTPKECFRLMGFDDESFHKAEAVNSNTQLYKQAGNSIVVDVAEELLCMMFDEDGNFFI